MESETRSDSGEERTDLEGGALKDLDPAADDADDVRGGRKGNSEGDGGYTGIIEGDGG